MELATGPTSYRSGTKRRLHTGFRRCACLRWWDWAMKIEGRANAALERVRAWGVRNKLRFAPQKTMAMVTTDYERDHY